MRAVFRAGLVATALLLSACVGRQPPPLPPVTPSPPPEQPAPPPPSNALMAGVSEQAPVLISEADAARALEAFRRSCPVLLKRIDKSGLTAASDWLELCAQAAILPAAAAGDFFRDRFAWVKVADGKAFATGYYEPEIPGSRSRGPGFEVPIHAKPDDLTRCYGAEGTGRGRIDQDGQCVLYYSRAEIEDGALDGRGLEIGWAADPVDLFFLQIQGSGRLRLPDGSVMRIGYADQNGREYVAIGRLLRDRGLLPPGGAKMSDIVAWIKSHPEEGRALMRENASYVFFRELTGPGPLGALGVAVTGRGSVAADPAFVPLGAPIFLSLDRPEASGLWVAQDTGGAIKGANRFDTFWGAGAEAERIAGGMSAGGQALILLPKPAAARAIAVR